jgi:hypothetical protein
MSETKENITDLAVDAVSIIKQLSPRTFNYTSPEDNDTQVGLVESEVAVVIPIAIESSEFVQDTMNAYMIKAIQELSAKVTALENA